MEVRLSKEQHFINDEGKFDLKEALKVAGEKAAVCFKKGELAPWDIREMESEDVLVKRGLDTLISDHVTPSQQVPVSLEIYEIPKIICMYLNNIGMQAADERSLRYTAVNSNDYLTDTEVELYKKWMEILQKVLWDDYKEYFLTQSKGDEKKAKIAIKKIAQENARSFITVFMPTSLTYTSNLSELNKVVLEMKRTINSDNNTELENLALPYLKSFVKQLEDLGVVVTNKKVNEIYPEAGLKDTDDMVYKDSKGIELNLFSNKNKFSGMHAPDEYGYSFNLNRQISIAGFAQLQRHRTIRTELEIPEEYKFFVPSFIEDNPGLSNEWISDSLKVRGVYPQGQMINVNMRGTLEDLIKYVGSERACNRAQYEIAKFYLELINDYYKYLENKECAELIKPYLGCYRCRTKGYRCPSPCAGGPKEDRKF